MHSIKAIVLPKDLGTDNKRLLAYDAEAKGKLFATIVAREVTSGATRSVTSQVTTPRISVPRPVLARTRHGRSMCVFQKGSNLGEGEN